ncbi:MAG: AAA family ATPase [Candidatus Shapirobacteria bacterium]|nr:AAA family ATPase [Candidatus Shapirobacteria bacterium]MDD3002346.1 AAA family ATPase [Candidatus Shapirobacteria bacterium]MDD4382648.1 AAA family ATPase [Candidatus Shapirobacteria bacterium]
MKIKQIEIKNFRNINSEGLIINDLEKYNLFIGKNNAGKSNIIKIIPFLGDLFQDVPKLFGSFSLSVNNSYSQTEDFFYKDEKEIYLSVIFSFNDEEKNILLSGLPTAVDFAAFKAELFAKSENTVKISFNISLKGDKNNLDFQLVELKWNDLPLIDKEKQILRYNSGSNGQENFDQYYSSFHSGNFRPEFNYINVMLVYFKNFVTRLRIIKAVRKIGGSLNNNPDAGTVWLSNLLDIDGDRTIDDISVWINPVDAVPVHRGKYKKLNAFVSSLIGMEIELVVSGDKKQIFIEPKNLTGEQNILPYKSWGSSVEELIVLIVDILKSPDGSVIALEEPEIHLDVSMQKKFISFLKTETDHQYLISSHSNVLINSFTDVNSSIFRVFSQNNLIKVEKADENVLQNVLDDLGIKASDILQTNGIIWVEGPSDRIFINKWISLIDFKLKEGIDYSIMFYGGRLLSHLSTDIIEAEEKSETDKFIKLIKLNRNIAMVIDSDKENVNDSINETKSRIKEEIDKNGDRSVVWITDGREIENYIPPLIFKDILGIDGMSEYTKVSEIKDDYKKVEGAKKLVENMTSDIFEQNKKLKEKMGLLVDRIKLWNKSN